MWKKVKNILDDFLKSARTSELIELYVIPAAITVILLVVFTFCNDEIITSFTANFADNLLTIAALLAAFGIASVTIILTSASKNIDKAKSVYYDRKNHNNIPISYYQLIIIRNYYNIFVQIFLLIIAVFSKFLLFDGISIIVLIVEVYFLMHSIFAQILVVTTLYHLLWDDSVNSKDIKMNDNNNTD